MKKIPGYKLLSKGAAEAKMFPIKAAAKAFIAGASAALADSPNNINDIDGVTGADPGWLPCYEPTGVNNSVEAKGSEK